MRDLSCFEPDSFDIVHHAHSLNFVPDAQQVFDQVVRVLRPGGQYRLDCWNPFAHGANVSGGCEQGWTGKGYTLAYPYVQGQPIEEDNEFWEIARRWGQDADSDDKVVIKGPREFRHTLGTLVNGLIQRGFELQGLWEQDFGDAQAQPGTWEHFKAYAPPWLIIWAQRK